MMEVNIRTIVVLLGVILINSCIGQNSKDSQPIINQQKEKADSAENFDSFYEKFHANKDYQLKRITFPLNGYNYDSSYNPTAKNDSDFAWTKNNWDMHHKPVKNDSLNVKWFRKNNKVKEVVTVPNSGVKIIRKFSLIHGKWYLVFYGNQSL